MIENGFSTNIYLPLSTLNTYFTLKGFWTTTTTTYISNVTMFGKDPIYIRIYITIIYNAFIHIYIYPYIYTWHKYDICVCIYIYMYLSLSLYIYNLPATLRLLVCLHPLNIIVFFSKRGIRALRLVTVDFRWILCHLRGLVVTAWVSVELVFPWRFLDVLDVFLFFFSLKFF